MHSLSQFFLYINNNMSDSLGIIIKVLLKTFFKIVDVDSLDLRTFYIFVNNLVWVGSSDTNLWVTLC